MRLSFKYPFYSGISGTSPEKPDFNPKFKINGYFVNVNFEYNYDEPIVYQDIVYIYSTKNLAFIVEEKELKNYQISLKNIIGNKKENEEILKLLTTIINRVLKAIRNFGFVLHVHEIYPEPHNIENYLRYMQVEINYDNGKNYKPIPFDDSSSDIPDFFSRIQMQYPIEIKKDKLPNIIEAIEDNLDPDPENEFLINAHEFLRVKNYRMCVVESIIALEIVLTEYLRVYLLHYKNFSKNNIKSFLNELHLKSRVKGLLKLTLDTNTLKEINFNDVSETIRWRNDITHEGRLKSNIKESKLIKTINSVIKLINIIAIQRNKIKFESETHEFANSINKKYNVPTPNFKIASRHFINVNFSYSPLINIKIPNKKTIEKIIKEMKDYFAERDKKRFDYKKHLYISFTKSLTNEILAKFHKGNLEILHNTK